MLLLLQAGKVPMTRGDQAIFENRRHSYTDVYAPQEPAYTPPPAQGPERNARPPLRNAVEEFIIEIKDEAKGIMRQNHMPEAAIDPFVNQMAERLRNVLQADPRLRHALQEPMLRGILKAQLLEQMRQEFAPHGRGGAAPAREDPDHMRAVFPHLLWSELKAIADFFNAVEDLKIHNAEEADKINLDSFEEISSSEKLADIIRANRWELLYRRQLSLSVHPDRTVGKSERTRELAAVVMQLLANLNDMIKNEHQANPMENAPMAVVVGPIKDRL